MSYFTGGCKDVSTSAYKSPECYDDPRRKQSSKPSDSAPGSIAWQRGGLEGYPANLTPQLKEPSKPSDPPTAGRSLATGS